MRLLVTTNYQNRAAAERLGYAASIEGGHGLLLSGACFYLMTARELAEKHGWRTILTDSAKLANIIPGPRLQPGLPPDRGLRRGGGAGDTPMVSDEIVLHGHPASGRASRARRWFASRI